MRHVADLIAVAEPDDVREVVLDDAEMVAVIADIRRQQQGVTTPHDPLLAQVGSTPVDFQRQLVRLDDLRRLGKAFAELCQEGEVPSRGRLVVHQLGVSELLGAALGRTRHEPQCSRIVPRLRHYAGREQRNQRDAARGHRCREETSHDSRISSRAPSRATPDAQIAPHSRGAMSFEGFRTRTQSGGLVPVWRDILLDTDTPVSAFAKLRRGRFAFLLESAPAGGETWSRYTFLGTEPRGAWRLRDGVVDEWHPDRGWHGVRRPADPIADLGARLREYEPVTVPELGAFWGGAVGYFGYDVVRLLERLPNPPPRALDVPDALMVLTRAVVIIDNLRSRARIVIGVPVETSADDRALHSRYDEAEREIDAIAGRLREHVDLPPLDVESPGAIAAQRSSISRP